MSNDQKLVRCNNCHEIHTDAPFGAGFENRRPLGRFCEHERISKLSDFISSAIYYQLEEADRASFRCATTCHEAVS